MIATAAEEPHLTEEHYRIYRAITGMVDRTAALVVKAAGNNERVMPISPARVIPGFLWIKYDTILVKGNDLMRIMVYARSSKLLSDHYAIASFTNYHESHKKIFAFTGGWGIEQAFAVYLQEIKRMLDQGWEKDSPRLNLVRAYENDESMLDDAEIFSAVEVETGDQHVVYSKISDENLGLDEGVGYLFLGTAKVSGQIRYSVENKYGDKISWMSDSFKFKPFNFDNFFLEENQAEWK